MVKKVKKRKRQRFRDMINVKIFTRTDVYKDGCVLGEKCESRVCRYMSPFSLLRTDRYRKKKNSPTDTLTVELVDQNSDNQRTNA